MEHWNSALTIDDYVGQMWRKKRKQFARNRDRTIIDDALRERFAAQPLRILIITEHYCEDSMQLVPVIWKQSDELEQAEVRVLRQHQHPELSAHYLTAGHPAIPVFILLYEQMREIGALVERPARVTRNITDEIRRFQQEHPDLPGIQRMLDRMPDETRTAVKAHIAAWREAQHDHWVGYLLDDLSDLAATDAAEPTDEAGGGSEATASDDTGSDDGAAPSGELIVAATADGYRTEPERANIGMYPLNTNIFESLVRLTPDYQVEPLLAESWEFVEPNTWSFTLREGVTFHDGTPLTSEAVAWSLGRIAAVGGGTLGIDETSVEIVDDLNFTITPARTNLRLLQQLNHPNNSIIAPNSQPLETRIGTRPYMEVEYTREDQYVVEAYDGYWGDKPKLARITFRFLPDATTRILALQSGEVDLIYEVPKESAEEISANSDLQLLTSEVGAYEALYFNIHGPEGYDLGQDVAVRRAVAYAIDKESIVTGVWRGNAEVSNTMIPPGILGSSGDMIEGTTFDLDQATQILEEAGWVEGSDGIREKDGRALKLTMIVGFPSAEVHKPMPELVQAQLRDAGIDMEIVQTPDTATYEARLATLEGDLWAEAGS